MADRTTPQTVNEYALIKDNAGNAKVEMSGNAQMSNHVGDVYNINLPQSGDQPTTSAAAVLAEASSRLQSSGNKEHSQGSQSTNFGTGNAIGQLLTKGAHATHHHYGGLYMTGGVIPKELAKEATKDGNSTVTVSVKYSDRPGRYQGSYRLDQPLLDVIVDINKKKTDRELQHIVSKEGDVVDEDLTIATLQVEGMLKNMTAVFK